MKLSLTLLESDSYIKNQILEALSKQANIVLKNTSQKILPKIKILLENALKQEPEYISLISGQLRLEFGIPDASSIDDIVKKLSETVSISVQNSTIKNNGVSGGILLTALEKASMGGLINDSSAMVVDSKGYSLPWLQWLLYEGNKPIVKNYEVKLGPNPKSRTGMAIMVDSNKNWRVPPAFAGTINNNWIIRALDRVSNDITKLIQDSFESSL
jgi:hypothetical protein